MVASACIGHILRVDNGAKLYRCHDGLLVVVINRQVYGHSVAVIFLHIVKNVLDIKTFICLRVVLDVAKVFMPRRMK